MSYCGPRGIPLSTFLTWEKSDQDAALVWQAYEARRCPGCGTHPEEGPKHFHVDVCAVCVQMNKVSGSEDAKASGAHLAAAPGVRGTCSRCQDEIHANSVRG